MGVQIRQERPGSLPGKSLGLGLPTPSPTEPEPEPEPELEPESDRCAQRQGRVEVWVELWDYTGGARFRGFVAGEGQDRAMFVFFDDGVVGKDLKPG